MLIDRLSPVDCLPPSLKLTKQQQTSRWFTNPLALLMQCHKELGNAFTIDIDAIGKHVFFCDAATVSQILKADANEFYSSDDKAFFEPVTGKFSLFNLQGESHLSRRRFLAPAFHHHKIKTYGESIAEITRAKIADWPLQKPIILLDELLDISLQVTFKVIFGLNDDIRSQRVKVLLEAIVKINRSGAFSIKHSENTEINKLKANFQQKKAELDSLLIQIIDAQRLASPLQKDTVLSMLIDVVDENNNPLSSEEIKDHLITLLMAGHETTGTAATWAIYWILRDPEIRQRLLPTLQSGNLDELPYLHAICQETLRIVPVIAIISRTLKQRVQCGSYILPKAINIGIPIFVLHQNPQVFPEPELFNPERFLNQKYSFYEYMPFGGGSRICIGMVFALYQMKIVLATLLNTLEIKLISEKTSPVRKGVVLAPAGGVVIEVTKRTHPK